MDKISVNTQPDIVILGGGLTGASLALMVQQSSLSPKKITVIDAQPLQLKGLLQSSFDARSTALSSASQPLLDKMQVWSALSNHVEAIKKVRVSRYSGYHHVDMTASDVNLPALGYVVENQILGQALMTKVQSSSDIQWLAETIVDGVSPVAGGYNIRASRRMPSHNSNDHSKIDADSSSKSHELTQDCVSLDIQTSMLVIAGGAKNPLVEKLGIDYDVEPYHQHALITTIETNRYHQQVAHERFLAQGPLALLPLPTVQTSEGQLFRSSVVWTRMDEGVDEMGESDDESFLRALQSSFGWRLGRFTRVGKKHLYPLSKVIAKEQVRSHLAIVGNAAHSLHPVAGQGFNLILRDLARLVEVWVNAERKGISLGSIETLLSYEKAQVRDQHLTVMLSDQLPKWFNPRMMSSFWGQCVLELGLMTLSQPGFNQCFSTMAMGKLWPAAQWTRNN